MTTAERHFKMLTAKKESVFSILQSLYDLSKDLSNEQNKKKFTAMYLTVDNVKDDFIKILDEINSVGYEIKDDYVADYKAISTVNELCSYIHLAARNLEKHTQAAVGSSLQPTTQIVSGVDNRPRLPKIELPEFSGEIRQWETFHSLYKSMVHNNLALTDLDKIHFLVGHLRGSALAVCAGISLTADNYDIIYKALVDKYENKRYLANSYLQQILEFKSLHTESEKNLNIFLERFDVAVSALKKLKLPDLSDFILLYQGLTKLDHHTVRAFEVSQGNADIPTYNDLINFVKKQAKILHYNKPFNSNGGDGSSTNNKAAKSFVINQKKPIQLACAFCQKTGHYVGRCEKFKALSPSKRYETVRDKNWCFKCLSSSHGVRLCSSDRTCSLCSKNHHILIHTGRAENLGENKNEFAGESEKIDIGPNTSQGIDQATNNPQGKFNNNVLCSTSNNKGNNLNYTSLLSTVVVLVVNSTIPNSTARFILDSGSEVNLLTLKCCKRLGLKTHKHYSSVQGLGCNNRAVRGMTSLCITSRYDSNSVYTIEALLVDKITDRLPKVAVDLDALADLKNIALADCNFHQPGEIDGIIGVELFANILKENRFTGKSGFPVAVQTSFGYVVMGKFPVLERFSNPSVFLTLREEQSIEQLMAKLWEVEQVPTRKLEVPEQAECEKIFCRTYQRGKDGRYTVALPFKLPPETLGDSRGSAYNRLVSLERRLAKDSKLRVEYNKAIQDFINQGHMGLVRSVGEDSTSYYIAHHPVIKLSSTSTPVRVVLDASAPSDNDVSLNDILYCGPKLQTDIVTLLLNFRLFKIAMTSDLRQMYRQIKVLPDHWRFQRLLWRFSPDEEIEEYEIRVVAFGLKASPYLALRTVQQLIKDENENFPLAAKFISRDLYMDDYCCSVDSEKEAIQLYHESINLFKAGGFDLVKWSSNSNVLMHYIPIEKRLSDTVLFKTDTKILGIQWDPQSDILSFRVNIPGEKCTKRTMLSAIAQCYDPLGLIAPFILYLKILIKKLWCLKLNWDESPPKDVLECWEELRSEWGLLEGFRVSRHIGIISNKPVIIFAFADASLDGYGAVVYARTVCELNNEVNVKLVCAKSKISPTKKLTVPRLELLAAHLLSKLLKHVVEIYNERTFISKILAFSDSSTVISWLMTPYLKDIFVANRIAQIKENIPSALWYHIVGTENPADCLSRGLKPKQLINHSMWLTGPSWMKLPESSWPCFSQNNFEPIRDNLNVLIAASKKEMEPNPFSELIDNISSWLKILRIVVFVLRFLKILPKGKIILASDLQRAENYLVKLIQIENFGDEINLLQKNQSCSSKLKRLHPFVQDGLLRVGGRIGNSDLSFDKKHPLILPGKCSLTEKLVDYYHKIYLHTGAQLLEAILRNKYWILGGRNLIRSRIYKCNRCFRLKPKNLEPLMGDLPAVRVQEAKAFLNTGVDYFGPIKITMGKRKNASVHKAYVSLFCCMSVKAIHLELVSSLSTPHFMQAFKRFLARRGPVKTLFSDNAATFVGAKRVLCELNELVNSSEYMNALETELGIQGVQWKFICPLNPQEGGIWESNVKSVKNHIYRVIGEQLLTYEEFATLLAQIEALLNSRPLCRLSSDPTAPEALTPAHFLTLTPLKTFPIENLNDISLNRLDRFQLIDGMVRDFWQRWRLEYLTTLQIRQKWNEDRKNILPGMIVLLKTENAPPLHWPLAIITEVHPGKDGVVRRVTVKTNKGLYMRPVIKICPLPTQ